MKITSFNEVTVGKIGEVKEIQKFLELLLPEAENFVIKPNWYSPHPGSFSTVSVMRQLLEAIDGKVTVIEGHSLDRQDGSMKFQVNGEEVNWNWLMNHSWEWVKDPRHKKELRLQEEWFLEEYGFKDLFKEFCVEYINISEEVWAGRIVDPKKVEERVKNRFGELKFKEVYGFMPSKMYRYEGSPLISLGKVKGAGGSYPSLSVKNLFGLLPDPLRVWWHGPENSRLDYSILDIFRLYESFFDLYGLCDGVEEITVVDPEGGLKFPWGRFNLIRKPGLIGFGQDLVELDSIICGLIGINPQQVCYLSIAGSKKFEEEIEKAKSLSENWFNFQPYMT